MGSKHSYPEFNDATLPKTMPWDSFNATNDTTVSWDKRTDPGSGWPWEELSTELMQNSNESYQIRDAFVPKPFVPTPLLRGPISGDGGRLESIPADANPFSLSYGDKKHPLVGLCKDCNSEVPWGIEAAGRGGIRCPTCGLYEIKPTKKPGAIEGQADLFWPSWNNTMLDTDSGFITSAEDYDQAFTLSRDFPETKLGLSDVAFSSFDDYFNTNKEAWYGQESKALPSPRFDDIAAEWEAEVDEKAVVVKNNTPTKLQWEAMKPLIQRLYVTEGQTFAKVAEYLQKHHAFNPS